MKAILDLIARHKAGEPCGMFSVCSAHPLVIEATFLHARQTGAPFALIEATSNQVNQDGGYTGMKPADFRDFVHRIADRVGLARGIASFSAATISVPMPGRRCRPKRRWRGPT